MLDAPKQDWAYYEEKSRAANAAWLRGLSTEQRLAIYCDMFRLIRESRDSSADWDALERWRWRQKLAARQREVKAYRKLDVWRERNANPDAA
jgi:hypothetical protein